jgi:hypothetical protein
MDVVSADWARLSQVHFGAASLGDQRRSRRLVKTTELIFKSPAGSLPTKLTKWSDLIGFYRLVNAPQVTHSAVIQPHLNQTLQQMRRHSQQHGGAVLLISDTTGLDYTNHALLAEQLGQIGNGGGRGYLCHNTLAVTPDRQVFGLASQILHQRRKVSKRETARQKREHPDRESRLWARGCEQAGAAPAGALWVDICDRGSDSFEYLEYEHAHARSYVIRSARDRSLDGQDHLGSDRIHHTLHGYARDLPVLGTKQVEVGASTKKGSKARVATVSLAAAPVSISVPKQPRGQCAATSLDLWVIRVAEINPPKNTEPLEWILLTNVPANTLEQISQRVDWYACRPMIEDYHKGQKTGVGIELPQFESAAGMEPVIGILSVVAAALLQLRHNARNPGTAQTPASEVVPSLWIKIVAATVCNPTAKKPGIDAEQMTAREFFIGVACLGGYLARKNDGPPGWLTLWRGWSKLHQMIAGANVAMGEKCV